MSNTATPGTTGATVDTGAPRMLSLKQFFGYGAGDTANNMAFSLAVSFLPLYLTDVALISPAAVGTIFLVMRLIDAVTDLIVGSIVDRTHTRWGKFRPYILFFSLPLIISTILLFSMPGGLRGTTGAVVWAAVWYFVMGSVFFTLVNIPYGSLASAMTQNRDERSKLALFRTVGAAIMQVTTSIAIAPSIQAYQGDPDGLQSALTRTLLILGAVAFVLYLFTFFTARENVERSVESVGLRDSLHTLRTNRALVMLAITAVIYLIGLFGGIGIVAYYARDIVGDARYIAIFATLLYGMVLIVGWIIPPLVRRVGKPRLYQLAALTGVVGAVIVLFAPAGSPAVATIGFIFMGASSGIINTLLWNMEADTVEYGEWRTGLRTEGTTYAVFSFSRKLAQAIGGALGVWIIGWFGYAGGEVVQSDTAQTGIRVAVAALPAVMFLLSAILMQFYPMSDARHREIVAEVRARHAERAATAAQPTTTLTDNPDPGVLGTDDTDPETPTGRPS